MAEQEDFFVTLNRHTWFNKAFPIATISAHNG